MGSASDKAYDLNWIFPKLRKTTKLWHGLSTVTIGFVGFLSKVFIGKVVKLVVID